MSSEPSDDERRIGAAKRLQSDHYCSRPTQLHDRLRPDLRSAADAAVRADRGALDDLSPAIGNCDGAVHPRELEKGSPPDDRT